MKSPWNGAIHRSCVSNFCSLKSHIPMGILSHGPLCLSSVSSIIPGPFHTGLSQVMQMSLVPFGFPVSRFGFLGDLDGVLGHHEAPGFQDEGEEFPCVVTGPKGHQTGSHSQKAAAACGDLGKENGPMVSCPNPNRAPGISSPMKLHTSQSSPAPWIPFHLTDPVLWNPPGSPHSPPPWLHLPRSISRFPAATHWFTLLIQVMLSQCLGSALAAIPGICVSTPPCSLSQCSMGSHPDTLWTH